MKTTPTLQTTTSYAYNDANQLCWRHNAASTNARGSPPAGATTFNYDAAGHQLNGDTTMAWDSLGRLSTAAGQATRNLAPTNGELVGLGTARFQNNLFGLARMDSSSSSDTTSIQRDPHTGLPVSQIANTDKRFFLQDLLGSTIALTDPAGTVARSYSYDPDGNTTTTGSGPDASIRFAAGHSLTGTGLYHFGARYYQPSTARWTQPDPINQITDLHEANLYSYVGGDPVNLTDPAGLHIINPKAIANGVKRAITETAADVGESVDRTVRRCGAGGLAGVGASAAANSIAARRPAAPNPYAFAVGCVAYVAGVGPEDID